MDWPPGLQILVVGLCLLAITFFEYFFTRPSKAFLSRARDLEPSWGMPAEKMYYLCNLLGMIVGGFLVFVGIVLCCVGIGDASTI